MKIPWLLQRGVVDKQTLADAKKLGDCIRWDYMSAPEFHADYLEKSLRRFERSSVILKDEVEVAWDKFRLFIRYEESNSASAYLYKGWVVEIVKKQRRLKRPFRGESDFANVWWDIENDVFITSESEIADKMLDLILGSVTYVNSVKK